MSVVSKIFKKLAVAHGKHITGPLLESLLFAYRANTMVNEAVIMALHSILKHI